VWLGYLADDPRTSLAYIGEAMEAHPQSPRAYAALRWAWRSVLASPPEAAAESHAVAQPLPPSRRREPLWAAVVLAVAAGLLSLSVLVGWTPDLPVSVGRPSVPVLAVASLGPFVAMVTVPPTPTATPGPDVALPAPGPTSLPAIPVQIPTPLPGRTPSPMPPTPTPVPAPLLPSEIHEVRWIDVDLTGQVLTAYEGDTPVRVTLVSTGIRYMPTPVGQFRIWIKLQYDDMAGPGYYLPDVPYTMYFYASYALHGTYWHDNFGHPMSHGCVNLPTPEAEWLFHWADVGTLVNIHY